MKSRTTGRAKGSVLPILFLAILAAGFLFSAQHVRQLAAVGGKQIIKAVRGESTVSEIPTAFDDYYNSLFSAQRWTLDAFSLTQRALGKREARNFQVLKADSGELYLHGEEGEIEEETLRTVAEECRLLFDETNKYGGAFLYVQVPYKNVGQAPELAAYSADITEESESCLAAMIREKGIPVLDLRDYDECTEYYRTDHHWTVKAAFNAAKYIEAEVERLCGTAFTDREYYGEAENYDAVTVEDCFLGSIGIKVGRFFGGRDDFTLYYPKFDTDLTLEHYIDHQLQFTYSGPFPETFIEREKLEDSSYNNKYDVNLHGAYVESRIINRMAQEDRTALLITHSYGRPMAQYMCLDYSELRYLDPQEGRFNDDLAAYIRDYQPDVVVFMFNAPVNVGDGRTE